MNRSYLFVPGNTPSMIQNIDVFESDAIILDIEDSVLHYDKDAARHLVEQFLTKYSFTQLDVFIRINDASTTYFFDDIKQTKDLNIKGYVLPKATKEDINTIKQVTTKPIIAIIESPMAVLHMEEIAKDQQVIGLLLGAEDLTKELNIKRTLEGQEILFTRSKMALVCHSYQIEAIDTPYINKDDDQGIIKDSMTAKSLGFTGKSSIHPNQIDTINKVFSPSEKDIEEALRIVKKAETSSKGAFTLDGKMVDVPIIEKAKKTLDLAKKYKLL